MYQDLHKVLVATKFLTAKLYSLCIKGSMWSILERSESGVGVAHFGQVGVSVGFFNNDRLQSVNSHRKFQMVAALYASVGQRIQRFS